MSEQNKPDPWASLASDLGIEIPPQEDKPQKPSVGDTPESPRVPPAAKAKPASRPSSETRKTPADWSRLASELGLELPPEAFEPATPTGPAAPSEPGESWTAAKDEILAEVVEEPTETEDGERSPAEVEISERPPDGGETKLRKRRKRRRKVRRDAELTRLDKPVEAPGQPIESAEFVEMVELVEETEGQTVASAASASEAPSSESAVEEAPKRSKRRRRRRSGRKKVAGASEQPSLVEDQPRKSEELPASEPDDLDDLDEDEADDAPRSRESEERRREKLKAVHRGIPSWREAIDVVIATNMEARAKHPDRGSHSRPRSRNRNGREKPSSEK